MPQTSNTSTPSASTTGGRPSRTERYPLNPGSAHDMGRILNAIPGDAWSEFRPTSTGGFVSALDTFVREQASRLNNAPWDENYPVSKPFTQAESNLIFGDMSDEAVQEAEHITTLSRVARANKNKALQADVEARMQQFMESTASSLRESAAAQRERFNSTLARSEAEDTPRESGSQSASSNVHGSSHSHDFSTLLAKPEEGHEIRTQHQASLPDSEGE